LTARLRIRSRQSRRHLGITRWMSAGPTLELTLTTTKCSAVYGTTDLTSRPTPSTTICRATSSRDRRPITRPRLHRSNGCLWRLSERPARLRVGPIISAAGCTTTRCSRWMQPETPVPHPRRWTGLPTTGWAMCMRTTVVLLYWTWIYWVTPSDYLMALLVLPPITTSVM